MTNPSNEKNSDTVVLATDFISYDDAVLFLRLDKNNDAEKTLIESLIKASVESVENYTNRTVLIKPVNLVLDEFPPVIKLPFGKIRHINIISYTDQNGQSATFKNFTIHDNIVKPATGYSWPVTSPDLGVIKINYSAGWFIANVPSSIKQACLILISTMYDNREEYVTGSIVSKVPTVRMLLDPYRIDMGV